jgi:hypothetical protein
MLSEAVDNLYASWIALEILCREPIKQSRVNADVNGLDSTAVSSIPGISVDLPGEVIARFPGPLKAQFQPLLPLTSVFRGPPPVVSTSHGSGVAGIRR